MKRPRGVVLWEPAEIDPARDLFAYLGTTVFGISFFLSVSGTMIRHVPGKDEPWEEMAALAGRPEGRG